MLERVARASGTSGWMFTVWGKPAENDSSDILEVNVTSWGSNLPLLDSAIAVLLRLAVAKERSDRDPDMGKNG